MKKDSGFFDNITAVIPVAVIAFLAMIIIQTAVYQASSTLVEDALVASNLASAVMDVEQYGISHQLWVEDPADACGIFRRALRANLALDEQWNSSNSSVIDGRVTITEYSIYEVRENDVIQYYFPEGKAETMYRNEYPDGVGKVEAPDGTIIYSTSVYSRIDFQVSFFNSKRDVYKQKCVDVVEN